MAQIAQCRYYEHFFQAPKIGIVYAGPSLYPPNRGMRFLMVGI